MKRHWSGSLQRFETTAKRFKFEMAFYLLDFRKISEQPVKERGIGQFS
jgi:hypothetical protein